MPSAFAAERYKIDGNANVVDYEKLDRLGKNSSLIIKAHFPIQELIWISADASNMTKSLNLFYAPPVVCTQNIFAWIVAGSLAYYFYVVPERKRAEEQQVGSCRQASVLIVAQPVLFINNFIDIFNLSLFYSWQENYLGDLLQRGASERLTRPPPDPTPRIQGLLKESIHERM